MSRVIITYGVAVYTKSKVLIGCRLLSKLRRLMTEC